MKHKELDIHLATDEIFWGRANKVSEQIIFKKPFNWLDNILKNMTGFRFPSGYAIISQNRIVKQIWVGDIDGYALFKELELIDRCIYINNYGGCERGTYGWINLSRSDIEETFNIRFDDRELDEIGGFPNYLRMLY